MSISHFKEYDLMPSNETTLDHVTTEARKLGYLDAILDLQRLMKDDLQLDMELRFAIVNAMQAKKDVYLRPTDQNLYDLL